MVNLERKHINLLLRNIQNLFFILGECGGIGGSGSHEAHEDKDDLCGHCALHLTLTSSVKF